MLIYIKKNIYINVDSYQVDIQYKKYYKVYKHSHIDLRSRKKLRYDIYF